MFPVSDPLRPNAMVQTSLPAYGPDRILCYYVNTTSQMQLARIANISGWLFERMVFPQQRLLFEAVPDAVLEIHSQIANCVGLLEQIPCLRLQVSEPPPSTLRASVHPVDLAE